MKKITYILFLTVFFLASCSKEAEVNPNVKVPGSVDVTIPVARGDGENTYDDSKILSARLIVFRSSGQSGGGVLWVNRKKTGTDLSISFKEVVPVGKIDIYMIANELASWNLGPANDPQNTHGLTQSAIQSKLITQSIYCDPMNGIPMYKCYLGVEIDADGNMTYNGAPLSLASKTVERLWAKVIVNMNFTNPQPVVINSVAIRNVPTTSYITPTTYSGTLYNGTAANYVSDTSENLTTGKVNRKYTLYIPEYLIQNKSNYCHLYISAVGKFYNLTLGNGIGLRTDEYLKSAAATLSELTITRNTCYIINIRSMKGEDSDVVFTVEVGPWAISNVDLK